MVPPKETLEFRYRVFKYILDYAAKAGLFDQVLGTGQNPLLP